MFMGRDHRTSRPTAKRVNATDDRRAVNSPRCRLRVLSNSAYLPVSNGRPILTSRLLLVLALLLFVGAAVRRAQPVSAGDEWQPITPEELKMTGEPKAPGAPAVILYRQVDRDDSSVRTPHEYNYVREKIFTEEGRKYANVEIPLVKGQWDIHSIRARTLRPDGSIVNFDGKVYEKEIVKARGIKYLAKTFTLSDVQPGSIIEYHYMIDFAEYYVFNSNWVLSDDLFSKSAKFTLKPYAEWALQWSWPNGLPEGTKPPSNHAKVIHMEVQDIPAFQEEDDMPPQGAMRFRVDFVYSEDGFEKEPEKFWKKQGKKMCDVAENFASPDHLFGGTRLCALRAAQLLDDALGLEGRVPQERENLGGGGLGPGLRHGAHSRGATLPRQCATNAAAFGLRPSRAKPAPPSARVSSPSAPYRASGRWSGRRSREAARRGSCRPASAAGSRG